MPPTVGEQMATRHNFWGWIWFIRGVLFVRVWGQPKYWALTVGFASRLSAGLVGQPADHMDLLGLQPHSKFNILLPSCFPPNFNLPYGILPCPPLFSRDMQKLSHWLSGFHVTISDVKKTCFLFSILLCDYCVFVEVTNTHLFSDWIIKMTNENGNAKILATLIIRSSPLTSLFVIKFDC